MGIYVVTFGLSLLFVFLSENIKNKSANKFFIIIAILIPCILAGMRDVSIGADTSGYVKTLFETAMSASDIREYYLSSFFYEWAYKPVITFDFGYTMLTYICAKLFKSFGVYLFCTEVLIMFPIVAALRLEKKHFNISIAFSLMLFFFIYYNTTFNAVRQWLSIGFAFLAMAHLFTDKNRRTISVCTVLSILFHKSGLLVILLIVFYCLVNRIKGRKVNIGAIYIESDKVKVLLITLLSIILLFSMTYVAVPLLSGIGLSRYVGYINGKISFSINQLIYHIPYLAILIFSSNAITIDKNYDNISLRHFKLFSLCMFFINAVLSQLATVMEHSWRVIILFGLFNIVTFSYVYRHEKNRTKRKVLLLIMMFYGCFYWYFTFVLTGRHGTVPFVFA